MSLKKSMRGLVHVLKFIHHHASDWTWPSNEIILNFSTNKLCIWTICVYLDVYGPDCMSFYVVLMFPVKFQCSRIPIVLRSNASLQKSSHFVSFTLCLVTWGQSFSRLTVTCLLDRLLKDERTKAWLVLVNHESIGWIIFRLQRFKT